MRKRRKIAVGAIVIIVAGAVLAWRYMPSNEEPVNAHQSTMVAQRGDISNIISASGSLSAQASAQLKASRSDTIVEITVEEGDYVEEGRVLVRFEDDQERLSLLRAENALKEAESELESARASQASSSEIQKKERIVEERVLELELKEKELAETTLIAPFSGIVSKIYLEKGELILGKTVSASEPILKLLDTSRLLTEVNVDEVDISQLKVSQEARITVDAYSDEIFPGEVVSIAPEATITSGLVTIKVRIELTKANPKLKPGFTTSTDIVVDEAKNVIILPVEEVQERGRGHVVMVLEEGEPSPRPVQVGVSDGIYVEITSGLEEGEVIVVSGLQSLIEMRKGQASGEEKEHTGGGGLGGGGGVRQLTP